MQKLTKSEMKNVMGGRNATVCVSCKDTAGYWNAHGNVMCTTSPTGFTCSGTYGSGTNGIQCMNPNTMEYTFSPCPVS